MVNFVSRKDLFFEKIKNDPKLIRYHLLEEEINNNPMYKNLIIEIKDLQKEMIISNQYKLNKSISSKNILYKQKVNKLNKFPRVQEYLELQKYFNDIFIDLKNMIEKRLEEKNN